MEDRFEHILFCHAEVNIIIIGMCTGVNDAIHIQVQIVKFRNLEWKKKKLCTDKLKYISLEARITKTDIIKLTKC